MLVLSRKKDEKIVIAGDITITVAEIRNDKVRLGIQAPPDVPVHRQEVWIKLHPPEPPPTRICAWCKAVLERGSEQVSHGICEPCAAEERKDLERMDDFYKRESDPRERG